MARENIDQGYKVLRKVVAIPAENAGAANIKTWAVLAGLTTAQAQSVIGVYCPSYVANSSTLRGAIVVTDDPTTFTNAEYVGTGQTYNQPATQDAITSCPADPANVGFNALAIFILLSSAGSSG